MYFLQYSNDGLDIPHDVMQRMKKQCGPARAKSFKERNPDLDLDEIQRNPNIPDDIKAVLVESALVLDADDVSVGLNTIGISNNSAAISNNHENLRPVEFKSKKELLAYMDDGSGTVYLATNLTLLYTYQFIVLQYIPFSLHFHLFLPLFLSLISSR